MHIFQDESGIFVPSTSIGSYSVVGSYVLAESQYRHAKEVLRKFKLRHGRTVFSEMKRRDLGGMEKPYFRLLEELAEVGGILVGIASDVSSNTHIVEHQQNTGTYLRSLVTRPRGAANAVSILAMADGVLKLSIQNYTELICRVRLCWEVLQRATGYFAQRAPGALARIRWQYDYKDKVKNHFESTLEATAIHLMERYALRDPLQLVQGANYSKWRDELISINTPDIDAPTSEHSGKVYRATKLFSLLQFVDSKESEGVQIADLLVNGIHGLLRGRFQQHEKAAMLLGRLMVVRPDVSILPTIRFSDEELCERPSNIAETMKMMGAAARPVRSAGFPKVISGL
jgi:hypothetical protein